LGKAFGNVIFYPFLKIAVSCKMTFTQNYLHPHKPWLIANTKDPTPEHPWYTPARYFARQLVIADPSLLAKRDILASKVSQYMKNAGIHKRGRSKYHAPSTIKKALVNVTLN
jgi:hypothetical protein